MDKCFEGISKVKFSEKQEVFGMISAEGEEVDFASGIDVNEGEKKGNVERWMLEIEGVMIKSLRDLTKKSITDYYNSERTQWVAKWPGQVILAVDQIDWTTGVEEVFADFKEGSMQAYKDKLQAQILEVVQLVRGKLSRQLRTTLKALVVLDVHGAEVV
jgi:dynein heavy chain